MSTSARDETDPFHNTVPEKKLVVMKPVQSCHDNSQDGDDDNQIIRR